MSREHRPKNFSFLFAFNLSSSWENKASCVVKILYEFPLDFLHDNGVVNCSSCTHIQAQKENRKIYFSITNESIFSNFFVVVGRRFCVQLFFFFFLHISLTEKKPNKINFLSFAVQQLFPFRSSIVKNENVTEKGMAKKSWKHFHSTDRIRSSMRESEGEKKNSRKCFHCCWMANTNEFHVYGCVVSRVGLLVVSCCRSNDLCLHKLVFVRCFMLSFVFSPVLD